MTAVIEGKANGRIVECGFVERAVIDNQSARKSRLNEKTKAGRKIEHYELRAPPALFDARSSHSSREEAGRSFPQNIGSGDANAFNYSARNRRVQVAGDGLGFR
jgi:hypothetical protein